MKLDVNTPDFCPDNCPNFEFTQNDVCRIAKIGFITTKKWGCKKEDDCKRIYDLLKENNEVKKNENK